MFVCEDHLAELKGISIVKDHFLAVLQNRMEESRRLFAEGNGEMLPARSLFSASHGHLYQTRCISFHILCLFAGSRIKRGLVLLRATRLPGRCPHSYPVRRFPDVFVAILSQTRMFSKPQPSVFFCCDKRERENCTKKSCNLSVFASLTFTAIAL